MHKFNTRVNKKLIKAAKNNNGRISAKEYREITKGASTSSVSKNGKERKQFSYMANVEKTDYGYCFTFHGKHMSNNVILNLNLGDTMRYKKAVSKALYEATLLKRTLLPKTPMIGAIVQPIVYSPHSNIRDDDNSALFCKKCVDSIVENRYLLDDKPEYLKHNRIIHKKGDEWMVELHLYNKEMEVSQAWQ